MIRILLILMLLLAAATSLHAANEGTIQSVSASGGANFNENITISISLRANEKVNNTNVVSRIIAPSGAVVASHMYDSLSLEAGGTTSYSWGSNNSGYPDMGTYTVQVCWSTGGSNNCNIASASTSFYSADSLGPLLYVGLALIGWLVWHAPRVGAAG